MAWPGIDGWLGTEHEHELQPLSWDELRRLQDAGWEIGSHACSHPYLTRLGDDELERELGESRRRLETELGRPCRSLAYPYGDHDERVVRAVGGGRIRGRRHGAEAADDAGAARLAADRRLPRQRPARVPGEGLAHRQAPSPQPRLGRSRRRDVPVSGSPGDLIRVTSNEGLAPQGLPTESDENDGCSPPAAARFCSSPRSSPRRSRRRSHPPRARPSPATATRLRPVTMRPPARPPHRCGRRRSSSRASPPARPAASCPGTYAEDVKVESGGAPGAPITLAAGPQGGATLVGRLWVTDSANDVVVRDLDPRRPQRRQPAEPERERRPRLLRRQRRLEREHDDLLRHRLGDRLRRRPQRPARGEPDPQLRHPAAAEPPPRRLPRKLAERRRPRQRHLRQRRQGHPRLPRLRREPDREQRDRRQLDRDPDRRLDARRPVASDLPEGQPRPAQRDLQLAALQRRGVLGVAAAGRRQQRRHRQLPLRRRLRDPDPGAVAGVAVGRGLHDPREPGLRPRASRTVRPRCSSSAPARAAPASGRRVRPAPARSRSCARSGRSLRTGAGATGEPEARRAEAEAEAEAAAPPPERGRRPAPDRLHPPSAPRPAGSARRADRRGPEVPDRLRRPLPRPDPRRRPHPLRRPRRRPPGALDPAAERDEAPRHGERPPRPPAQAHDARGAPDASRDQAARARASATGKRRERRRDPQQQPQLLPVRRRDEDEGGEHADRPR